MSAPPPVARRILVVDDDPQVCEAVKMLLEFDGHMVVTVPGGREALELLGTATFDLVLTDFSMPNMKGDELARRIKQRFPGQRIAMVTAYAEVMESSGSTPEGVDMIISKPFLLQDLRAVIARLSGDAPVKPG